MRIKRLNEQQYFAQSFSGDGYNTSNGVFKVHYKAYDDLSISRGQDAIPSNYIKGQEFQIGDLVHGKIKNSDSTVTGRIISMIRDEASSEYSFKVKSDRTNKIFPVVTSTLEIVTSSGFSGASRVANIDPRREKLAMSMKYNSGSLVWGKLESMKNKNGDVLLTNNGQKVTRKSVLDNSLTLTVVGADDPNFSEHDQNFKKLGIAYMDTKNRTIYIDSSNPDFQRLSDDHLVTIEAHELAHNLIKDIDNKDLEILCDLVAAKLLRNKGYYSPYKIVVSNFLGRHKSSYGESLDNHQKTLDEIIL